MTIWDSWTLCLGFREVRGHAPREKNRNLRSSNSWKCIEIVNPTTTTLFLYHFKSFTIPSGPFRLFGGGGGACAPRAPRLPTGLHTLRKPVTDVTRHTLSWNPAGKRIGRPRSTWQRSVEDEAKKVGKSWPQIRKLAKNRVRWRAFVD